METSVIKFIDYQWLVTIGFMKNLFWFYFFFYIMPYSITLVSADPAINRIVFNICVFPQLVLLGIEMVQFYEQGSEYFQGWNIVDLL